MAAKIDVQQIANGEFDVRVTEGGSQSSHRVTVKPEDYQRLTGGKLQAQELVRRSFEFLLENEPKASILSRFALGAIARDFRSIERDTARRTSVAERAMSLAAMVLADRGERLIRHYDRWIGVVTLGRDRAVRSAVLGEVRPGDRLLVAVHQPAQGRAHGHLDRLHVELAPAGRPARRHRDVTIDLSRLPAQEVQLGHVGFEVRPLVA